VGHQQQSHPSDKPDRLPSPLSAFRAVLLEQGAGIVKHMHGVFESDAMFPLVGPRFHRVPLEIDHR